MATHKVTYETTDKPDTAKLPKGATVETVSPFPALVSAHRRTLRVNRVADNDLNAATVKITTENGECKGLPLTEAEAREIGEALIKAAELAATERTAREKTAAAKAEKDRKARQAVEARRLAEYLRAPLYRDPYPRLVDPFRF